MGAVSREDAETKNLTDGQNISRIIRGGSLLSPNRCRLCAKGHSDNGDQFVFSRTFDPDRQTGCADRSHGRSVVS